MMHADVIAYEKNQNRHIYDFRMGLDVKQPDGSEKQINVDVYGPSKTKIMARTVRADIGGSVSRNGMSARAYSVPHYAVTEVLAQLQI